MTICYMNKMADFQFFWSIPKLSSSQILPPYSFFFSAWKASWFLHILKRDATVPWLVYSTLYAEQQFPSHGCTTITRSTRRKSFFTELTKRCSLELECTCLAHFLLFFWFWLPSDFIHFLHHNVLIKKKSKCDPADSLINVFWWNLSYECDLHFAF